jgi:hypothetical protein
MCIRRAWLWLAGAPSLGLALASSAPACSPTVVSESSASSGSAPWTDPCCYGGYNASGGDERTVDAGFDASVQDGGGCSVQGLLAADVCIAVCGYGTTCALVDAGTVYCYGCAQN